MREYVESRIVNSLYHISDRNQWNLKTRIFMISIRMFDLEPNGPVNRIFQSDFEYIVKG